MCVATALGLAGTVIGGIAQYQSARAQANAAQANAESQAKTLEYNAAQARNEAAATSRQGANETAALEQKQRRLMASQRAVYGASGVELGNGSAGAVETSTALTAEQDKNQMRENYQRKRFGLVNEAVGMEYQARSARAGGEAYASAAKSAAGYGLAGSLMSGAGLVASKWDDLSSWWKGSRKSKAANGYLFGDNSDWHDTGNALYGLRGY